MDLVYMCMHAYIYNMIIRCKLTSRVMNCTAKLQQAMCSPIPTTIKPNNGLEGEHHQYGTQLQFATEL